MLREGMTTTAPAVEARDTERFRAAIAQRLGLSFDESKWGFLAEVLQRRIDQIGQAAGAYLERLEKGGEGPSEMAELARELTVGETYFFRNTDQFRAMAEVVLPERVVARAPVRTLRLLSAGCASGEEAYSLAILVRERLLDPSFAVSILGIDVNRSALDRAESGRYSAWSLRETPDDIRRRWFRAQGRDLILDPTIREGVRFETRNLVNEDPVLWGREVWDVIFCRNVLMYFTPQHAREVMARLAVSLAPGGYLFLGHAETLRGLSNDFHLQHTHGTFYYQRKGGLLPRLSHPGAPSPETGAADASGVGLAHAHPDLESEIGDTWFETIRRASERIQALTRRSLSNGASTPPARPSAELAGLPPELPPSPPEPPNLGGALELLKQERFTEALSVLGQRSGDDHPDADALLLRAALLTHSGQLHDARDTCADLLRLDQLNAGAHYLLALCREGGGDRAGALRHDQVAAYLDPSFAMPRLHMGLLARRAGDAVGAGRELSLALPLLQREEAPRLLLFGGGFSREALVALCRSELQAATGKRGGAVGVVADESASGGVGGSGGVTEKGEA